MTKKHEVTDEIMEEVGKIIDEAIENGEITEDDMDMYTELIETDEEIVNWVVDHGTELAIKKLGLSEDDTEELDTLTVSKFHIYVFIEAIKYMKARHNN